MTKPIVGWLEITPKDAPMLPRSCSRLSGWSINDAGGGSGYGLSEGAVQ